MIMEYYDGYMDMEDIRELFHTSKSGTSAYDIVEGAKSIGFFAKGFSCSLEKFLEEEILCPCIANVVINQSYSHYVVIFKIDKKKKELTVADPANKIIKMKFDIFKSIYSGNLIILYPEKPLLCFQKKEISWQNVFNLLKGSKKSLLYTFLLSIFVLIYAIVTSFYGEMMLKNLQSNQKDSYLLFLFLVFLSFTFIKLTSDFFRSKLFLWIEKKIDIIFTEDIFWKVLSLPYSYYHNHTTGDIMSRIQSLDDIKVAIMKWIMVVMVDIPLMSISFICLYFLHSKLAMLVILFFLIQLLILKIFQTPLEEKILECQQESSALATLEVESIRSFDTVKGISLQSYFHKRLLEEKVLVLKRMHQLEELLTVENYGKEICQEISSLLLLLFGCLFVRQGTLSFATLLTIQNLSTYFYTPVRQLIDLDRDTKQAKNAWKRISVFDKKDSFSGYLKKMEIGSICFQNVSYSYRPDVEILHHVNLKISNGEKLLVLGHSGSGKSTLFKLLKKYYEIPRGMILINGNDINDYENTREICYINQTENLYTGSMLENIQLGEKIEENYFQKIVKICGVEEIAQKDQLGYYKLIEENGMNLSGGERQRIVLARTFMKPFQILIIDEGLNQIDVNLERKILKGIFREFKNRTIIVISHREENIDLFDRKVRMRCGIIEEDVKKNGRV